MARVKIRLLRRGVREVLKSDGFTAEMVAQAEEVKRMAERQSEIRRNEMPIIIGPFMHRDRAAASVTIAHPGGMAVEAKHGTLIRSAGSIMLDTTRNYVDLPEPSEGDE